MTIREKVVKVLRKRVKRFEKGGEEHKRVTQVILDLMGMPVNAPKVKVVEVLEATGTMKLIGDIHEL